VREPRPRRFWSRSDVDADADDDEEINDTEDGSLEAAKLRVRVAALLVLVERDRSGREFIEAMAIRDRERDGMEQRRKEVKKKTLTTHFF